MSPATRGKAQQSSLTLAWHKSAEECREGAFLRRTILLQENCSFALIERVCEKEILSEKLRCFVLVFSKCCFNYVFQNQISLLHLTKFMLINSSNNLTNMLKGEKTPCLCSRKILLPWKLFSLLLTPVREIKKNCWNLLKMLFISKMHTDLPSIMLELLKYLHKA